MSKLESALRKLGLNDYSQYKYESFAKPVRQVTAEEQMLALLENLYLAGYLSQEKVWQDVGKSLVKIIKSSKLKVQASIQGDKVRVTGKKRDDLQQTMTLLKESKVDLPLQFENFRD